MRSGTPLRKLVYAATVAVVVAAAGITAAVALTSVTAVDSTATQTFTFTNEGVATYTIPTVTVTTTVTTTVQQPPPAPPPPAPPPPPPPLPPPPPPPPPPGCTRTLVAPGNLQTFLNGGQLGESLCLSGTFSVTSAVTISNSAFQIQAVPSGSATIVRPAGSGTFSTVLEIHGDNLTLKNLDIQGGGQNNCLLLGNGGPSQPAIVNDLYLDYVRLHACGNDNHEHAIYAEFTRRLYVQDSWIYGSGGYGVQFYPDADDSIIDYTVIDGNDVGTGYASNVVFASGDTEYAAGTKSERDTIRNSNITFSSPGSNTQNITTSWNANGGVGTGHVIQDSCVYSPGDAELAGDGSYPTLTNITRLDPLYTNRATGNFTLQAGSPCVGKGPR
jgi:hypothetical protein